MNAKAPPARISVLTAVYNRENYLPETIESILAQTYQDFEYILVDDASTDSAPQILARYAAQDARIRVLHNPQSLKPGGALNRGLEVARGEYVAILDCDDLAHPERLARQAAFLDAHAEIGMVGAFSLAIDSQGKTLQTLTAPTSPELAQWAIFFRTPVLHSSAMLRHSVLRQVGYYRPQYWTMCDYDLAARISACSQVTNLPEVLTSYRRHEQQVSSIHQQTQGGQVLLLIYRLLQERLGLKARLGDIAAVYDGVRGRLLADTEMLQQAINLLETIRQRHLERTTLDEKAISQINADCAERMVRMAFKHRRLAPALARRLLQRARQLITPSDL